MAINPMNLKKSMLNWEAISKKAPDDIKTAVAAIAGAHPEAVGIAKDWTAHIKDLSARLHDALDKVITAKDDKGRASAGATALSQVKQYQNYVNSSHLPPEVQTKLKNGLNDLAKNLA